MTHVIIPRRAIGPMAEMAVDLDWTGAQPDETRAVFGLLAEGSAQGIKGALVTIVDVMGGSARGLGAQMAVLEDGRFCGYVSGGCVEAAVAAEAIQAIKSGQDQNLRLGAGSRLMDIKLPCGGSIDLRISVGPAIEIIEIALRKMHLREEFSLSIPKDVFDKRIEINGKHAGKHDVKTGWIGDVFHRIYQPKTKLVLIGRGLELEATTKIAISAGIDTVIFSADDDSAKLAESLHVPVVRLSTPQNVPPLPIDSYTAVVFLFHEHDWENALMPAALAENPFFIGALGSVRTHEQRKTRLLSQGISKEQVALIKGPIGLFGPTRDASALALSILAQVSAERMGAEILVG